MVQVDRYNLEKMERVANKSDLIFTALLLEIRTLLTYLGNNDLGSFNEYQLVNRINDMIAAALDLYVEVLGDELKANVQDHGDYFIESLIAAFGGVVAFNQILPMLRDRLNYMVDKMESSYVYRKSIIDGLTINDRIKTIKEGAERVVRSLVRQAYANGEDAWSLARKIEGYLDPKDSNLYIAPWTIIRRQLGLPVTFKPTGIPAGSVKYNALRIARTEIAEVARTAVLNMIKNTPNSLGAKWNLSAAHTDYDICDVLANADSGLGKGVYKVGKYPRVPHPNCLCYPTGVMAKDWLEQLAASVQYEKDQNFAQQFDKNFITA